MRLGRKAVKHDSRTLKLSRYLLPAGLPPAPETSDWTRGKTRWGVMCNDTLGCCTIAGVGHAVQVLTQTEGTEFTATDQDITRYYSAWDGYVSGDPSTDNGGICLNVLNNWKNNTFDGHGLLAFASVNPTDDNELKQAISIFGGVYIGMTVPNFIMNDVPQLWDVVANDGGIDGGHCVFCPGYDTVGVTFISWGNVYKMTWAYWNKYVDEAYALIGADFVKNNNIDPCGFSLSQLQADLALIK